MIDIGSIPDELKQRDQWVLWKLEPGIDGKITKVPYTINGYKADKTKPSHWSLFQSVTKALDENYNGIGFCLCDNDPFCFIDLDRCVVDGKILDWALDIIERFQPCCVEFSQSGNGLHIFIIGKLPENAKHKITYENGKIEVYDRAWYFAITGNVYNGYEKIQERQTELNFFLKDYDLLKTEQTEPSKTQSSTSNLSDLEIIEKASKANYENDVFNRLFYQGDVSIFDNDDSRADYHLAKILAFWTQKDFDKIERIMRTSALSRDKWTRKDYIPRTINNAINNTHKVYDPGVNGRHKFNREGDLVAEKEAEPIQEKLIMPFRLTDYGNAERLVYYHGENIRYCEAMKSWFIWDGKRWKADDCLEIERLAKDTVRRIYNEAGNSDNENQRKAIADHAKRSEANNKIQAMVSLARSESGVIIRPNDLDRDGFLLNCENGTIDLRTGELLPHRKTDNITKIIPVSFDPIAECPRWELFLKEIFKDDKDIITFIKYAVGYSLTGSIKEECIFICYGTGRNGKSKFLDTLEFLFGDYGKNVDPTTFEENRKFSGSASEDIARLKDARFISTIETAEGRRLSESLVKKMTGDRIITARELYQKTFQFEQLYKIWLATNHKPIIRGTDNAIWERIKLIPFEVYFSEEKRDKDLLEKLISEAPGILNWAVEGCLLWQGMGLYPVTAGKVKDATNDYRTEMDLIGEFINEKCIQKSDKSISKQFLYNAYSEWCKESGINPESKIRFGRKLKESYDIKDDSGTDNVSIWKGLALKYIHSESQQN